MEALDWPLTRMRSLHRYFGGWSDSKTRSEMTPTYYCQNI